MKSFRYPSGNVKTADGIDRKRSELEKDIGQLLTHRQAYKESRSLLEYSGGRG